MLEACASAIEVLFQPIDLLVLLAAVIIGLIVGVILDKTDKGSFFRAVS